jgi:integrase
MATFTNAQQVKALLKAADGKALRKVKHSDTETEGLFLDFDGSKRGWMFKFTSPTTGKRREMGLGAAAGDAAVSLADARGKATEARALLHKGVDPLEHRRAGKPRVGVPTFGQLATEMVKARQDGWKGGAKGKSATAWRSTLSLTKGRDGKLTGHCQAIVHKPVDAISVDDVLGILQPLWREQHETACHLQQRIQQVLDAAKASGHRSGDNPADKRLLSNRLPKVKHRTKHRPSMPYAELPAYMASLKERKGVGSAALRFCILTAARENEAAGAMWSEVQGKTWVIPAARMKSDRDHRVALSTAALAVLSEMAPFKPEHGDAPIFPSRRGDSVSLAGSTLLRELQADRPDVTVHGMRTTFRTWCQDRTRYPREVAEAAIAHVIAENEAEAAYARSDLLEQRRELMQMWSDYCEGRTVTIARHLRRRKVMLRKARPVLRLAA